MTFALKRFVPAPAGTAGIIRRLAAPQIAAMSDYDVDVVFATSSLALDNDIWSLDGMDLSHFREHAAVLFNHDPAIPVGRASEITVTAKAASARVTFPKDGVSPDADKVRGLVKAGTITGISAGIIPLESEPLDPKRPWAGQRITKSLLLEFSFVSIPSDANSKVTARSMTRALDGGKVMRSYGDAARAVERIPERGAEFANLRDFYVAIRAATFDNRYDRRLERMPRPAMSTRGPSGLFEADPTQGGFLVRPTYANDWIKSLYEDAEIAPLTDVRPSAEPLVDFSFPGIDETSRADGSRAGGALAYWEPEAPNVTSTKPRWKNVGFAVKKLIAIAYVTDELLRDADQFEAHMLDVFTSEIGFKLDASILSGTGAGVPAGLLTSAALITIPKQGGQGSGTVVQPNISAMWARLPAPCRKRAVWLVNEDVESMFDTLNVGDRPNTYIPAGVHGNEFPLLKGRPMITIEQAPALGTLGDIVLADLTQYVTVHNPLRYAISADAGFLSDQSIMRFVLRVDGQCKWASPITPYNGSQTRSPYVTLAAR